MSEVKKREIKFRSYIYGEMINSDSLAFEIYAPVSELLTDCENIMQFTGLYDKNGVEIYEGDIVKSAYGNQKDTVVFKNGSFFCFGWPMGFQEEDHMIIESNPKEWGVVIGNIHQNKELI